jgi:hypothetical protein
MVLNFRKVIGLQANKHVHLQGIAPESRTNAGFAGNALSRFCVLRGQLVRRV